MILLLNVRQKQIAIVLGERWMHGQVVNCSESDDWFGSLRCLAPAKPSLGPRDQKQSP